MNNLKKFNTEADYTAATLNYPAVSWVVSDDIVHFDKETPTPSFSGLTVYYNITDISQATQLFKYGGGSGSGSGSGSGGVLPSAMVIDGTAVEVTATYQFDTVGEHIVNYSFADNTIPDSFLNGDYSSVFQTVKKIEIGDAITSIGKGAFYWCTSLTSIDIPDSVTSISGYAFNGCTSLTSCTIGSGVTSIGDYAFQGCTSLTNITVDSNNTIYSSEDSVLFNKAKTTLMQYPIGNARTSYTIPSGVTSIGYQAFLSCTSLTSIDIPSSVTSIGASAFQDCRSLTSVTIGNSVTSIGGVAFQGCRSLTSIDIPNSVTSIGVSAFQGCTSLTSCTIGSGVTIIDNGAFQGCSSLTSIVSNATTAPTIQKYTFQNVHTNGTLTVPSGSSGYNVWMQNADYYLGLYGWTKVEQ